MASGDNAPPDGGRRPAATRWCATSSSSSRTRCKDSKGRFVERFDVHELIKRAVLMVKPVDKSAVATLMPPARRRPQRVSTRRGRTGRVAAAYGGGLIDDCSGEAADGTALASASASASAWSTENGEAPRLPCSHRRG
ncbi:hypothetical protein PVAP13_5KG403700 [Panicum virgatum]|uniref:Uncharacterized protein n=1 Tax=Panicum virgatum TaxID=38727 RepID=A0A8T0SND2_PANVG|nr:hypothetical protein PVAP13_5KG403700 [Panicum virgatum]